MKPSSTITTPTNQFDLEIEHKFNREANPDKRHLLITSSDVY